MAPNAGLSRCRKRERRRSGRWRQSAPVRLAPCCSPPLIS